CATATSSLRRSGIEYITWLAGTACAGTAFVGSVLSHPAIARASPIHSVRIGSPSSRRDRAARGRRMGAHHASCQEAPGETQRASVSGGAPRTTRDSGPPALPRRALSAVASAAVENVGCPLCAPGTAALPYHAERGHHALQCVACGLVYMSPRPSDDAVAPL